MTWKVTVVSNTIKYKEWHVKEGIWERHPNKGNLEDDIKMLKKWLGRTITEDQLPELVKDAKSIILTEDEAKIYNDYVE